MNVQVLVSTMNQRDYNLVTKMNIQSDAIFINQCSKNDMKAFDYKGNEILYMSLNERGVGLSRNNALMRANADICLMADDDMVYVNGYKDIVLNAFKDNPKADMILFNVPIHQKDGETKIKVKKNERVRWFNSLKYGTVNIAFKKNAILKKNIYFSLLFGGGAVYGSGEDTLFIRETLKKGLKIYSCTEKIANIYEGNSTWFTGYNEKYLHDRGALFAAIWRKRAFLLNLQFLIRHNKLFSSNFSMYEAFKIMMKGSNEFNNRI